MPQPRFQVIVFPTLWADNPAAQRLHNAYEEWFNSLSLENQLIVTKLNQEFDQHFIQGVSNTTIKASE